jgi:HlyD family secretion protein
VDEGQKVEKGALIAKLDVADLDAEVAQRAAESDAAKAALAAMVAGSRPDEIAAAEAAMKKADAYLAELKAGSRPQEIAVAEAELASAQADQARAEANFLRNQALFRDHQVISEDEFDRVKNSHEGARARLREAQQRLELVRLGPRVEQIQQARAAADQARAQYQLVKDGPRSEDRQQARARAAQAAAALELAKIRRGYAELLAPMSGMVMSKNIEPGEYVVPGTPIVTVGNLRNVWLRGYVNLEDDGRVKLGQVADVTTESCPGKVFQGHVSFISQEAEFTPKNVQTSQERVKLVIRVKVDVENPDMALKPGMPADAVIHTDGGDSGL